MESKSIIHINIRNTVSKYNYLKKWRVKCIVQHRAPLTLQTVIPFHIQFTVPNHWCRLNALKKPRVVPATERTHAFACILLRSSHVLAHGVRVSLWSLCGVHTARNRLEFIIRYTSVGKSEAAHRAERAHQNTESRTQSPPSRCRRSVVLCCTAHTHTYIIIQYISVRCRIDKCIEPGYFKHL